jgi:hypothetical protein
VPFWNADKLFLTGFQPSLINPAHNVSCCFDLISAVARKLR